MDVANTFATMRPRGDMFSLPSVVGGGTAGAIAAIQASRAGAKVVLIEHGSQLGGTTTVGGVAFPGLFHAWGKPIISGIGWELVEQTVTMDGGTLPDFARPVRQHWQHQVLINPFLHSVLAEEACLRSGVTIDYYEFPLSRRSRKGGSSKALDLERGGG